jgi:hypothetical protein
MHEAEKSVQGEESGPWTDQVILRVVGKFEDFNADPSFT